MTRVSAADTVLLNKLVSDCITFGLKRKEALEYIEREYHPISKRAYNKRRAVLMSEATSNLWLDYFTRIGFVQLHKEQMDNIQNIQDDSLKQYFNESIKQERNKDLILRLKSDIRENSKLLSEYGLGTPVISAIKQRLQKANTIQ